MSFFVTSASFHLHVSIFVNVCYFLLFSKLMLAHLLAYHHGGNLLLGASAGRSFLAQADAGVKNSHVALYRCSER